MYTTLFHHHVTSLAGRCVQIQAGRKALAHPDISTAAVLPFTQPALFLHFDRDATGCISLSLLLHYISLQTTALRLVSSVESATLIGTSPSEAKNQAPRKQLTCLYVMLRYVIAYVKC